MKATQKIRLTTISSIFCIAAFCLPQSSNAQRFGHGGGGGFRGGGGSEFHGGGRTINGGSHIGDHAFGGVRGDRPAPGRFNEGIYHHAYGYHPYFSHPFHPYVWGPYWYPFGFFCTALTVDAIMFDIASQDYYYDNGVYYIPASGGYTVVAPPIGAVVGYLPAGYMTVPVGDGVYYYYGGAFYVSQGGSFRVVPAPVGAIVTEIPEGAAEQTIDGEDYLLYNNTYYQPISQNGRDAYEVVQVN